MTEKRLGIAIIGCGYVFDHYMTTAAAHPELRIVGVYDIAAERAAIVGKHYDLRVYSDFATLANDPEVELVLNLTSIESHYNVTRALLLAGTGVSTFHPVMYGSLEEWVPEPRGRAYGIFEAWGVGAAFLMTLGAGLLMRNPRT